MFVGRLARPAVLLTLAAGLTAAFPPAARADHTYEVGDVFISVGEGEAEWWSQTGTHSYAFHQLLQGAPSVFTTGSKFDPFGNLYLTGFDNQQMNRFDTMGTYTGPFGFGDPQGYVESLSITRATGPSFAVYAGQSGGFADDPDPQNDVLKFNETGLAPVDRFNVEVEKRGSDEIDLGADLCSLYYTSEGMRILRYDVCLDMQLPDFTDQGTELYALRILPDGGVIAADTVNVKLFDTKGTVVGTFDSPGNDCWFGLNLDPVQQYFWSADRCSNETVKFDITDPGDLDNPADTQTPPVAVILPFKPTCIPFDLFDTCVFGVSVFGERTAATGGVAPDEEPLCDAKLTLGVMGEPLVPPGKKTAGGNAKVGKDGFVMGQQQFQDHGPADVNFHSITIDTLTCADDKHAEVAGNGRMKDVASGMDVPVTFRIELEDNGTPGQWGAMPDTYHITLFPAVGNEGPTGILGTVPIYDSSKFPLLGGNITIHKKRS